MTADSANSEGADTSLRMRRDRPAGGRLRAGAMDSADRTWVPVDELGRSPGDYRSQLSLNVVFCRQRVTVLKARLSRLSRGWR